MEPTLGAARPGTTPAGMARLAAAALAVPKGSSMSSSRLQFHHELGKPASEAPRARGENAVGLPTIPSDKPTTSQSDVPLFMRARSMPQLCIQLDGVDPLYGDLLDQEAAADAEAAGTEDRRPGSVALGMRQGHQQRMQGRPPGSASADYSSAVPRGSVSESVVDSVVEAAAGRTSRAGRGKGMGMCRSVSHLQMKLSLPQVGLLSAEAGVTSAYSWQYCFEHSTGHPDCTARHSIRLPKTQHRGSVLNYSHSEQCPVSPPAPPASSSQQVWG